MLPTKQTVLIVDDEEDIRDSLRELLQIALPGYDVVAVESGNAGLALLKGRRVNLIITDYKMPELNGLEFLAEAKKLAPNVPSILVTAFPDLDLAVRAINEARIENFVTKPIEPTKVIDVVKGVLSEKRQQASRDQAFARSLDALRRQKESDKS